MSNTNTLNLTRDQMQALWNAVAADAENRRDHFEGLDHAFCSKEENEGFRKHLDLIQGLEDMLDTMKADGVF